MGSGGSAERARCATDRWMEAMLFSSNKNKSFKDLSGLFPPRDEKQRGGASDRMKMIITGRDTVPALGSSIVTG